tara:strand:+ start:5373 stop:7088 length:1716 start_codon:yes stop_codon:yes gene_type:complete
MKQNYLKFIFFYFIILFGVHVNGQDYYWSNNKKIPLIKNETKVLVKALSGDETESYFQGNSAVGSIERININSILITAKRVKMALDSQGPNFTWSYLSENGKEIIPTGELLLKPKKGVGFKEISQFSGNQISLVKEKYNTYRVFVEDYSKLLDLANRLYESGLVEYCHPNFIMEIKKFQNDPLYPDQYYLNNTGQFGGTAGIDINAPQAWAITTGLTDVRVAVIDDGVENHVDINGRVVLGFSPLNATGFGAPVVGSNHGQACAGIVGATQNNNEGISGVAPCVDIVPINIFIGGESTADLADAIDWAWDEGEVDVLSNSWGFDAQGTYHDNIAQAIGRARTQGRDGRGAIVVFSSGNENLSFTGVTFPGNVSGVLTVGAIDNDGNIQNYSSRGTGLDLVAPSGDAGNAGDVVTTDRLGAPGYTAGNYTTNFNGTSAACPQVAGVAALMVSFDPFLTESQIKTRILNTATGVGYNTTTGHGRLNAQAALQQVSPRIVGPSKFCPSGVMKVGELSGGTITWSVSPSNSLSFTQGVSTSTFTTIGSFSGSATITATLNPACGTTWTCNKKMDN